MIIQHNMLAWNANRQFKINTGKSKKLTEKLASGYKINRAADDAAGLAMSEKMRRQIRGLNMAAENIQEGVGYVQTADGALNEAHDILHRMNELAVKAGNGTLTEEDRGYIDSEVQQLKSELDRIFSTTTFNEERIWDPDETEKIQIGSEFKQAVTFSTSSKTIDVTNDNCGVLAYGSYKLNADDSGISVSWTGYDGLDYETQKVDWITLEANHYSFEMSDYFNNPNNANSANLFDASGQPVFERKISFSIQETTTIDDMKTCIDGVYMSSVEQAYMSGRFETNTGGSASNNMNVTNVSINYGAAYASNTNKGTTGTDDVYNFDGADDVFLEAADSSGNVLASGSANGNIISKPSATTVAAAQNSTEKWQLSFYMDGIGAVKATSRSVTYWASNVSDWDINEKDLWWYEQRYSNGRVINYVKERTTGTGTLGDVMSVLTGEWEDDPLTPGVLDKTTPGLLTSDKGGSADSGGYIEINFGLTADNAFSYGTTSSSGVGSFSLRVQVKSTDTEQDVLDRIHASLTSSTIVDLYKTSSGNDYHQFYNITAKEHKIEVPIWGGTNSFYVQAGVEAGQHIDVKYDCLSVLSLGMKNTNVLTAEAAGNAIDEIKSAIQDISAQRATFGAYQNRLEHAYNANKNTEENTAASESIIRDTDMADMMVEHSNQNILLQAGQAMLAQANQSNQGVLSLLG